MNELQMLFFEDSVAGNVLDSGENVSLFCMLPADYFGVLVKKMAVLTKETMSHIHLYHSKFATH